MRGRPSDASYSTDVGIVRTNASLVRACGVLDELAEETAGAGCESVDLRSRLTVARLVAAAARARRESRGVHYNADHPDRDDENWQHDSLMPAGR